MSNYALFNDVQTSKELEDYIAKEEARKADLRRRAKDCAWREYHRRFPAQSKAADYVSDGDIRSLLATNPDFSERFQVNTPHVAMYLANCGFRFAGMFIAPIIAEAYDLVAQSLESNLEAELAGSEAL